MTDLSFEIWCGEAELETFISILHENNIEFNKTALEHKNQGVSEAVTVVQIIQAVGGLGIAGVLIAWINQKANRTVKVQKSDGKLEVITKGYSANDVNKITQNALHIVLVDKDNEA